MFDELLDGIALDANSEFMAEDGWITIHPNGKGKNADYARIYVDDDGIIQTGAGGKFNGKSLKDAFSKGGLTNTEKTDKIRADEGNKTSSQGEDMNAKREKINGTNVEVPSLDRSRQFTENRDAVLSEIAELEAAKRPYDEVYKEALDTINDRPESNGLSDAERAEKAKKLADYLVRRDQKDIDSKREYLPYAEELDTEARRRFEQHLAIKDALPPVMQEFYSGYFDRLYTSLIVYRNECKRWTETHERPSRPKNKDGKSYSSDRYYAELRFWEEQKEYAAKKDSDIEEQALRSCDDLIGGLMKRVEKKVGQVTGYSGLRTTRGNSYESLALNGRIDGEKGSVMVSSVDAGGYNIQRYHVRVLIKPIK